VSTIPVELILCREADPAWSAVIRPWFERGSGRLERALVVVPTRGQAHALKQRCAIESVPLIGVEFLTPGLARKKWLALRGQGAGAAAPALGREFLLLGLRALIDKRLAGLKPEDAMWGLWKSLQSDPERALDDFDELMQAGFKPGDFKPDSLGEIFTELAAWVGSLGYGLAATQDQAAALTPVAPGAPHAADRLLVYGLGPESWSDFFPVAALVRRCAEVAVVLPEPEFRGAKLLDERWVELWSAFLGVESRLPDVPEPPSGCGEVAGLWTGDGGSAARARLVIGHTRADEMSLAAAEIARLLDAGAADIAVIFPRADAAHLRLVRLLAERGIAFADLIDTAAAPPIDVQILRALLAFYEGGCRLEELLELWPLLHALNLVSESPAAVRGICDRLFDEAQTHELAAYRDRLAAGEGAEPREIARVAAILLPPWPKELSLAQALARFEAVCGRFKVALPAGWEALTAFAARERQLLPARVVFSGIASFLPRMAPAAETPGRGLFARVTLTTPRRAAGVAWSHAIFIESNAGTWPQRRESSCWLTDERRRLLSEQGRFSLGLFTGDERAALEKRLYTTIARDTREEIVFTAALFDEEEPELRLAPNAWVERVILSDARWRPAGGEFEEALARLARSAGPRLPAPALPDLPWRAVWNRRRDPAEPFDEFFFCAPPDPGRPARLAAHLIERGIQDPAEFWFGAVLRVKGVKRGPLTRARKKTLGQQTHRLLAEAFKGGALEGVFMTAPSRHEAAERLARLLAARRAAWPADRYWDSFHAELSDLARKLFERVFSLGIGRYVAVEADLPTGATIPIGGDLRFPVYGRMDLVLLDRPAWDGAEVDIVDFKTGADPKLSAERMAACGASLQLGVYLAAIKSMGVAGGRVLMLKPDAGEAGALAVADLPVALALLTRLGQHLSTGRYGALTADRTEFTHGFDWPLACAPVRHAVLAAKFAATFGVGPVADEEEIADE